MSYEVNKKFPNLVWTDDEYEGKIVDVIKHLSNPSLMGTLFKGM